MIRGWDWDDNTYTDHVVSNCELEIHKIHLFLVEYVAQHTSTYCILLNYIMIMTWLLHERRLCYTVEVAASGSVHYYWTRNMKYDSESLCILLTDTEDNRRRIEAYFCPRKRSFFLESGFHDFDALISC